ncbi:MAG: GNAT family N-acetyltransferase [Candidatus Thorarchaeota archaeon]|jgi:GNAT superfamily N-acetyltransferase
MNVEKDRIEFRVADTAYDEFKEYYAINGPWEYGPTEEKHIRANPNHLITWRKSGKIIGHAIWHESNSREHTQGDKRTKQDYTIIERLMEEGTEFIELHELWLGVDHRGSGYGSVFFDFFENYVKDLGHKAILHHTDNPSAIALCRKRGYLEAYGVVDGDDIWTVFYLVL